MKTIVPILSVLLLATACKEPEKKVEEPSMVLTAEILNSVGMNFINPLDDWEKGYALVQNKYGKPTAIVGKTHYWAVLDGEGCLYAYVDKKDENKYYEDKAPQYVIGAISSTRKATGDICVTATGRELP